MQLAQSAPQIYDLPYLHRQMIETLGVKNAAKIVPMIEEQKPRDPVTENMDAIMNKPLKAFMYQDHEAHLQTHMSLIQDPKMMQMVGQSPQGQQIMAALSAHIMEHTAYQYRREIEKQLGAALPPSDDAENELSPQVEVELSRLAAEAAAQLLQKDQQEAQAQQAQQQAQDPLVQMQQMDLQIKQMQAQTKAQQVQIDAQIRMAEQQRKQQKDLIDAAAKEDELRLRQAEIAARTELDAARLGVDIEKHKTDVEVQKMIEEARLRLGEIRDQQNREIPPQ
jgi:hypothetical protein